MKSDGRASRNSGFAAALLLVFLAAMPALAQEAHKHHRSPVEGIISLDAYLDGATVHVLTGETAHLWYRRAVDGGASWSTPVRVDGAGAAPGALRPGNDAQIAAMGDRLIALWPVAGTGMGGGPFVTARSSDGGRSWQPGPGPVDTGSTASHGFADLLFDARGLHAVWLDRRDKAQGLRYARSTDDGATWSANESIAPNTCECCRNTLARGESPYVLFRGKGPRDMQLAAMNDTGWVRRGAVAAFDWDVKGCPETGGGLVVAPDRTLHATLWTGLPGKEGLYYSSSRDAGMKWSAPQRFGAAAAQHSDLAVSAQGVLGAVWDDDGAIRYARSDDGGRTWSDPQSVSGATDSASHPRVVWTTRGFLILWTERNKEGARELRTTIR